jgi:asparagine synthase (glutamine-hydrolysing)
MCGIIGQISFNPSINSDCSDSLKYIHNRGPDNSNIINFSNSHCSISLGHTRLAIQDLSILGSQPMMSVDKRFVIVFNGEIYNFKHLRLELIGFGYHFLSNSDTEVLLIGYLHFGLNFFKKIEGMFAFVLLDLVKSQLIIGRDPFGKKPLFIYHDNDQFSFSSNLLALRNLPYIKQFLEIDDTSIYQFYMFGFIPSPKTIFKQAKKFEPGVIKVFDLNRRVYSDELNISFITNTKPISSRSSEKSLIEELEERLDLSIKKRLIADVNPCVFLSGGVDSSVVLAKCLQHGNVGAAYTISMPGYINNELNYAKEISNILGCNLETVEMNSMDLISSTLDFLDDVDEPIADAAAIPLWFLSSTASRKFKLALGGDGGDEIFGGYVKYTAQHYLDKISNLSGLFAFINGNFTLSKRYKRFFEGASLKFHQRQFIFGSGGFLPSEMNSLFRGFNFDDLTNEFEIEFNKIENFSSQQKSMILDTKFQLPDWYLAKSDRATMGNGMELRSPLLDKSLVEFMYTVPDIYKIKKGITKYLLKRVAEKYIPKEIIYRKKMGFSIDLMKFINDQKLKEIALSLNSKYSPSTEWISKNYESLDPLQKVRIIFMNHYLSKLEKS